MDKLQFLVLITVYTVVFPKHKVRISNAHDKKETVVCLIKKKYNLLFLESHKGQPCFPKENLGDNR